eukprot:CAMPEP_0185741402 /NCGR_PEP_ID=MMETSP1171-20130828/38937_1 /TAXON_ID=374046 /ORGANISM="Helicotheca tamensis, Strain CCMP826" /LENGTH=469 /DNA_ID=CAMNT_0028413369 /DNA_START=128 /DNA_END=1537 /DNA_ORIENTATION=+
MQHINPKLNAIVSIKSKKDLLEEARAADEHIDKGIYKGWLHGIPTALKDLSNAEGLPTTMGGSKLFSSQKQQNMDDSFVRRMRNEGAIFVGKTNAPEIGLGSHTFNEMFGCTSNPYDESKSAGGSSGGAAVSLSSRIFCLADGSDMMGSLRNPAGWNGIYSKRPTAGMISDEVDDDNDNETCRGENENKTEGKSLLLPYPISTPGPMARSPLDVAAFLQTMAGPKNFDASTVPSNPDVAATKIGWLADWSGAYPMEEGILPLCETTLHNVFENKDALDCHVEKISSALFDAKDLWYSWTTIRSRYLSDVLSEALGGLDKVLSPKVGDAVVKPEVLWEVERGLRITDQELQKAINIAGNWSNYVMADLFSKYDVCALPSAQVWPFDKHQRWPEVINGYKMEEYHRWMEIYIPVSLAGLPCVTIPAGYDEEGGLFMGLQLFGPRGSDSRLLSIAQAYHMIVNWPSKYPPLS